MAYNKNNIFAKILNGTAPCVKIAETKKTLTFMDIMPAAPGHCLIIPKFPAEDIFTLPPDWAATLICETQRIAVAVKKALDCAGIVVLQLNGAAAGQTVFHLHFHIIPRAVDDVPPTLHGRKMVQTDMLQPIADKIIANLNGD